jgi:hypothetical protein
MSDANFNNNAYINGKHTLIDLSKYINLIMSNNTTYNKLIQNTETYLSNTYTKNTKNASTIKENFMKYIEILKKLYEYNVHYENLLKKYGEKYKNELQSLKKTNIKNNKGKELNAKKIRDKIFEILIKQKLKVRGFLTKIKSKINTFFENLSNEKYDSLKKFKKIINNQNIKSTLRSSEHQNEYKNTVKSFSTIKKLLGITFNKAGTKQEYLNMISNEQQNKINKINSDIMKSLTSLNRIKANINNLYINNENVNSNK